jgi:hypothetical protein
MPLLASAILGAVLAAAAFGSRAVVAAVAVLLMVVLAVSLSVASDLPDRLLSGSVVGAAGIAAVVALAATDPVIGAESALGPILWVLGPAVVAVLFLGLARRHGGARSVEWLAVTSVGVVLAAFLAAVVALGRVLQADPALVAVTGVAAVVGVAVGVPVVPGRRWLSTVLALAVVGMGMAAVALVDVDGLTTSERAVIGAAVAVVAAVGARAAYGIAGAWTAGKVTQSGLVATVALAFGAPVAAGLIGVVLS